MPTVEPSALQRSGWLTTVRGLLAARNEIRVEQKRHLHEDDLNISFEDASSLGKRFLAPWRALIRPVFSGKQFVANAMWDHSEYGRPVLFVGNHG
jgi:hypothetical protein